MLLLDKDKIYFFIIRLIKEKYGVLSLDTSQPERGIWRS